MSDAPHNERDERLELQVLRGTANEEELAALIAVLSEAYVAEEAAATVPERPVSAWNLTRRGMRTSVRRDIPWGRFTG